MSEQYKLQKLAVYQSALEYVDRTYELTKQLPDSERYNLRSQLERASTSIALNIAEGSTGQSDAEQNRFLGLAVRSYLETVECLDLIERRGYVHAEAINGLRENGHQVFIRLQAFRKKLLSEPRSPVPSSPSPVPSPRSPS
jgi:four helix bundle protein